MFNVVSPMDWNHARNEFARRLDALPSASESRVAPSATAAEVDDATDVFRWLRNNSPRLDAEDKRVLLASGLVETCSWFCDHYFRDSPLARSVLLQFLANFSANDEHAKLRVFQRFCSTLRCFVLHTEDFKLLNNSVMLLYNLCLSDNDSRQEILKDVEIIKAIMEHWRKNELEYCKIFLDSIFSNTNDFLFLYKNLPDLSKAQLMDLLSLWLDHFQENVAAEIIVVIKNNCFMDCTIDEITRQVVDVLAKASYIDKFNLEIKKDTLLLHKLIDLLEVIHERGKHKDGSNDEFGRVKNLSALFANSELQTHDRFWFKSDIIRLIANMCYDHRDHQNLMRSKNVIPILLECCSFDAKNPLMREWSLFALRNVLNGNLDNQNFVKNIDSVGSVDLESSIMLTNELGMAAINSSTSEINDTMFI